MPAITEQAVNNKSLTNEDTINDLTWDEATMTWDEATATWNSPGRPITKITKNNKSLSNSAENT